MLGHRFSVWLFCGWLGVRLSPIDLAPPKFPTGAASPQVSVNQLAQGEGQIDPYKQGGPRNTTQPNPQGEMGQPLPNLASPPSNSDEQLDELRGGPAGQIDLNKPGGAREQIDPNRNGGPRDTTQPYPQGENRQPLPNAASPPSNSDELRGVPAGAAPSLGAKPARARPATPGREP
jgi:hypothetical protein